LLTLGLVSIIVEKDGTTVRLKTMGHDVTLDNPRPSIV